MDPQHRHDLEENDLLHFLSNFKVFWAKWGTKILCVILVLILAYIGYDRWTAHRRGVHDAKYLGMENAKSAQDLVDHASKTSDDPAVAARSYLGAGDLFRVSAAQTADPALKKQNFQNAKDAYQRVIDMPGVDILFKLNAHEGLAVLYEDQGDFEAAKGEYQTIQKDGKDGAGTYLAERARRREAALSDRPADWKRAMEPLPEHAPTPTSQPATAPATQPETMPAELEAAPTTQPGVN